MHLLQYALSTSLSVSVSLSHTHSHPGAWASKLAFTNTTFCYSRTVRETFRAYILFCLCSKENKEVLGFNLNVSSWMLCHGILSFVTWYLIVLLIFFSCHALCTYNWSQTVTCLPCLILLFSLRFNYMHYDKKHGAIHKSIEALDRMGMEIIETGNPDAFKQYLSEFDNTICGRHPISVFLHVSASSIPSNVWRGTSSNSILATLSKDINQYKNVAP